VIGYGLDGRLLIPSRSRGFSLLHAVQTGSDAQGTGDSFSKVKAAGA
jgi:hypothetical protein